MTPDLLSAIFTSDKPRCMGCGEPATVHDDPWTLCASCDEALTESLRQSGFPEVMLPARPVQS
jgi:hypothetical protein